MLQGPGKGWPRSGTACRGLLCSRVGTRSSQAGGMSVETELEAGGLGEVGREVAHGVSCLPPASRRPGIMTRPRRRHARYAGTCHHQRCSPRRPLRSGSAFHPRCAADGAIRLSERRSPRRREPGADRRMPRSRRRARRHPLRGTSRPTGERNLVAAVQATSRTPVSNLACSQTRCARTRSAATGSRGTCRSASK